MELARNQTFQETQRLQSANPTPQRVGHRIMVEPGQRRGFPQGHALGAEEGVDAVDGCVAGDGHGGEQITKLWGSQTVSQNTGFGLSCAGTYPGFMPYDAERSRAAVLAIINWKGTTPYRWSLKAGFSGNVLGEFLAGRSESLKVSTAIALAEAMDINPLILMGITPSQEMVLPEEVMRQARALITSSMTKSAEASAEAENSGRLIQALAQAMGAVPSLPPPAALSPKRSRPRK